MRDRGSLLLEMQWMWLFAYVRAMIHRPYGTSILYWATVPTLKRGATEPCAYGAAFMNPQHNTSRREGTMLAQDEA